MGNQKRPIAQHGVRGGRYARRGATAATVKDLLYLISVEYSKNASEQDLFGDNKKLLRRRQEQPETGTITTTSPDPDFEAAIGIRLPGTVGVKKVRQVGERRFDLCFSPTYVEKADDGSEETYDVGVKVWLHNVAFSEGNATHGTNTDNTTFANATYNMTIYGVPAMVIDEVSGEPMPYMDEHGEGRELWCSICTADEEGYDTFDQSPPDAIIDIDAMG